MTTFDDELWQGNLPSVSWDVKPPHTVEATVLSQRSGYQTDIKTGKRLEWDDGNPRRKAMVTLCSTDGELSVLHVKIPSALYAGIVAAITTAKAPGLRKGDLLTITYTGDGEATGNLSPPKLFSVLLEPGAGKVPDDPFAQDTAE